MPPKKERQGTVLRIHSNYTASIKTIAKDVGWREGDPIELKMGDDGFITIQNLQPPGVIERRVARLKIKTKRKTNAEVDDSFRNLVWMYQDELAAIRAGDIASDLFSLNMRKSMRRKGILAVVYSPARCIVLSEEAEAVLDEVLAENDPVGK